MLTFHIVNVYVDKTKPRQLKFTFKDMRCTDVQVYELEWNGGEVRISGEKTRTLHNNNYYILETSLPPLFVCVTQVASTRWRGSKSTE